MRRIGADWLEMDLVMKLRGYNRKAMRVQFGSSLYAMIDLHIALLLMRNLGSDMWSGTRQRKSTFCGPGEENAVTSAFTIRPMRIWEITMKKLLMLLVLLVWAGTAMAVEVAGVMLAPRVQAAGETLNLNGYGIRKKFFFKVYVGSLYTAHRVSSVDQVLATAGGKLIRMNFLYNKVEKEKIVGGFAKGFENNAPELQASPAAKAFLELFDSDFVSGDQVDLGMAADGTVSASHNGRMLGSVQSKELARGVLLIYLGKEPADADMKDGMLGLD